MTCTRYDILECSALLRKEKTCTFIGWVPEKEQLLFDASGLAYNLSNFREKIDSYLLKQNEYTSETNNCMSITSELNNRVLIINTENN